MERRTQIFDKQLIAARGKPFILRRKMHLNIRKSRDTLYNIKELNTYSDI